MTGKFPEGSNTAAAASAGASAGASDGAASVFGGTAGTAETTGTVAGAASSVDGVLQRYEMPQVDRYVALLLRRPARPPS